MAVTRASAAARKTTLFTSKTTQKGQNSRVITKKKNNEKQKKHGNSNTCCPTSPVKVNKSPGVRLIGGRIYDSENGKTCHQVIHYCYQILVQSIHACMSSYSNDHPST